MASVNIVIANVSLNNLFSYRRCMKNISTNVAFVDAINSAIQILNAPKSILDTNTVVAVNARRIDRIINKVT